MDILLLLSVSSECGYFDPSRGGAVRCGSVDRERMGNIYRIVVYALGHLRNLQIVKTLTHFSSQILVIISVVITVFGGTKWINIR